MAEIPEALKDSPFGPDKLYMATRAYITVLKAMFGAWDRFHWDKNPATSRIIITKSCPYHPDADSKMPAIVVAGGSAVWQGSAPSQHLHADPLMSRMPREYADVVHSSLSIFCISKDDVEAGLLGWNVFNMIPTLREHVKRLGGADYIDNKPIISSPYDAQRLVQGAKAGDWWVSQVDSVFRIAQQVSINEQSTMRNAIEAITVNIDGTGHNV